MAKIYTLLLLCMISVSAFAQQITVTGSIKDTNGQPVPFTSVYLKNTTQGTSANVDGKYSIKLNKGIQILSFRAIGYNQSEGNVNVGENNVLNVVLTPESYTLNNVTIKANAEDPAYEIIRKTIKQRKVHLNEVKEYSCNVYIKGVQRLRGAPKKFFGRDIQKLMELDTNRKGIIYLSESESKFSYRRPNDIKEEMISSKVAGRNNAFSFNKASDLPINFYDNYLLENTLSARGFISPIADNALFYYKYKYLGETRENGEVINKIEVIPRRANDPVFRGIIYITDDNWAIYNTDLYLTKNAGINFIDTLNINQQFTKIKDVYMPTGINFQFNGNVLGFKFAGYYLGQKLNYIKKDSIAKLKESKPYLDSLERENNKFGIGKLLLTGYSINDRFNKESYRFDPVLTSIFYNTVEGFAFKYGVTYRKEFENRKYYTIRPEIRYGFANQKLTGSLTGTYLYNPAKRASITASFGNGIFDLNNLGSMPLLGNALNSLLYEKNFSKFYEKSFLNLNANRELANGLQASVFLKYNRNKTLINESSFKLRDNKELEFTSNNPFTPTVETPLFPDYTAFAITAALNYTFGQKYITRPDGKFYTESKYPSLSFSYRKGFKGILNSDVDYDFVKLEINQDRISSGLWGYTSFLIGAGAFINNKTVFYPDYKHFEGNISLIFPPNLRKFQFLDFYQFSTSKSYAEAHVEHNFSGFFINKIPLLRKLKLEEFIGGGYLYTPDKRDYKEFYFGLSRLIFRASYGFAYDGKRKITQGVRLSYGF